MEGLVALIAITLVSINLVCLTYMCKNFLKLVLKITEVKDLLKEIQQDK